MRKWTADLERLDRKPKLDGPYYRALEVLKNGDQQTAQTLLAKVVAEKPGYEEATRYLYLAVTGVDAVELQSQARKEAEIRGQREQELQQSRIQLESERKARQQAEMIA